MQNAINPCCLTIAGSDSGGNAGVQADLRVFHAFGMHGCTVFSAMTAQNPSEVAAIHLLPTDFVAAQLDAVLGVYDIRALKTGMLSSAEAIEVVADRLSRHPGIKKVVDPVMIATSGARLISDDATEALEKRLLPLATVITPNLPEAHVLAGDGDAADLARREGNADTARRLAAALGERFGCAVLVKGGHGTGLSAVDVLYEPDRAGDSDGGFSEYSMPWIENPASTHGTGCSLAAALAAGLAMGRDLRTAVAGAKRYVYDAIRTSYFVGPDGCAVLGFPAHEIGSC